jgi:multidrug efflux pump subunit AcrA (membrane-fusion protein)
MNLEHILLPFVVEERMKKTLWIVVGLAVVGFVGYRVYTAIQAKQVINRQGSVAKAIPVEVTKPTMSLIVDRILQTGTVSSQSEVTLYSKVAGKLVKNLVEMNDIINPSQVVALIDRDEVGYTYNQYELKSNAKGTVAKVFQNPGAVINPNTPLYLVIDIEVVKAVVAVPEANIRFVPVGHSAVVTAQAYPDQRFVGKVTNHSAVANPASRTIDVEVSVVNPKHLLKPGMFVQAEFVLQKRTAMLVPLAAVTEREGKEVVFTAMDSIALMKPVTTGSATRDSVEITSGLQTTDRVVVTGTQLLNDRDRIRVSVQ